MPDDYTEYMGSGGSTPRKNYAVYAVGLAALLVVIMAMVSGLLARSASESASVRSEQPAQTTQQPATEQPSQPGEGPVDGAEQGPAAAEQPAPPASSSSGQSLSVRTDTILPSYQDVPVAESVTVKDTVTARVVSLTPTASDGRGAGEIDGPALAVTVEVRNDSGSAVNLNTAGVTLSLGSTMIPAAPLPTQSLSAPFTGELASGQSASGTYVFLVPEGSPQDIRIEVTYGGDKPLIVFSGTRP